MLIMLKNRLILTLQNIQNTGLGNARKPYNSVKHLISCIMEMASLKGLIYAFNRHTLQKKPGGGWLADSRSIHEPKYVSS